MHIHEEKHTLKQMDTHTLCTDTNTHIQIHIVFFRVFSFWRKKYKLYFSLIICPNAIDQISGFQPERVNSVYFNDWLSPLPKALIRLVNVLKPDFLVDKRCVIHLLREVLLQLLSCNLRCCATKYYQKAILLHQKSWITTVYRSVDVSPGQSLLVY